MLLRLGRPPADASPLVAAAAAARVPLEVVDIEHAEAEALYGRRLVLVRPDGHVAWRGNGTPVDAAALIERVRGAR